MTILSSFDIFRVKGFRSLIIVMTLLIHVMIIEVYEEAHTPRILATYSIFLSIEVARSAKTIYLPTRTLDILSEVGMSKCKTLNTPMDLNSKLMLH